MTTRYFQLMGGTFAVWDSMMSHEALPIGSIFIAEYDETLYPAIHIQLNANPKTAIWNAELRTLTIGGIVVIDGIWIDARAAEIAESAQSKAEDALERQNLLNLAANALAQIATDQTNITTGHTSLATASTLAQVKPIVDGILTILDHICTRQEREIKALRAILRSGLN